MNTPDFLALVVRKLRKLFTSATTIQINPLTRAIAQDRLTYQFFVIAESGSKIYAIGAGIRPDGLPGSALEGDIVALNLSPAWVDDIRDRVANAVRASTEFEHSFVAILTDGTVIIPPNETTLNAAKLKNVFKALPVIPTLNDELAKAVAYSIYEVLQ